jgi:hypothetical protein
MKLEINGKFGPNNNRYNKIERMGVYIIKGFSSFGIYGLK